MPNFYWTADDKTKDDKRGYLYHNALHYIYDKIVIESFMILLQTNTMDVGKRLLAVNFADILLKSPSML